MKRYVWLTIPVVGFIACAAICGSLLAAHMPGYGPGVLFMEAGIIPKLVMMLLVLLMLPILALGGIAVLDGKGQFNVPLRVMAGVAAALGCFAALYAVYTVQVALSHVGPVSFAVTAPSYAEAALVAATGFLAAVFATAFSLLGDRRR